jgi:hypothetical protein
LGHPSINRGAALDDMNLFVAFVHPNHDGQPVSKFFFSTQVFSWVLSTTKCFFPDFGNSITGTALLIVGVHDSTQSKVVQVLLRIPPSPRPLPLAAFVWQPFNKQEYSVSFAKEDSSFTAESNNGISATPPSASILASLPVGLKPIYFLHARDSDKSTIAGTAVLSLDSLCPPLNSSPNSNIFRSCFGIEFHAADHTHVRAISPFEFTLCFGLNDQLRYRLTQHINWYALDGGIPALTSA